MRRGSMLTLAWLIGLCIATSAGLASAQPAGLADAAIFLRRLYAHYPIPDRKNAFSPFGRDAASVWDRELLAQIRLDEKLAHGEEGALDYDPICQCQDDDGLKAEIGAPRSVGATAEVPVTLRFGTTKVFVTFVMSRVGSSWRVHDIRAKDTPSLLRYLTDENRKHAHGDWRS
jgi:hypothetical protein